jgi:hypothetical protein
LLIGGGFTPDNEPILKDNCLLRSLIRTTANVVTSVDKWRVGSELDDLLHLPSGKPGYFSTSCPAWLSLR